jgi:recombinational DNA repair protein (RecF pathway)
MKEYFTEAIVLGLKPSGVHDRIVNLYTKDFGRLEAKVVAARKITSKLSPHLGDGNLIEARLVEKNRFILTDAVSKRRFAKNAAVFEILILLKFLLPELVSDLRLWHGLVQGLEEGKLDKKMFLKLLGYNALFAECDGCGSRQVSHFSAETQVFLCKACFSKMSSPRFRAVSI